MDSRGWNQEFRTMADNIAIHKKLERDLGLKRVPGAHLRTNLKEIIAVEDLFEAEGWLIEPTKKKSVFENMDKTSVLHEDLTQFWALCGQNRNSGITAILSNKSAAFKNVRTKVEDEEESRVKDLKVLRRDVEKLIATRPVGDDLRNHFEVVYMTEIADTSDVNQVDDFYWQVRSGYETINNMESDSDTSVDSE